MIYFFEVRNIEDDKTKSGRVQLRAYCNENLDHTDTQKVKDEHLPWGFPVMPSTSAGTGKVGIIPTGLEVGSRVACMFSATDTEKQYPIIIGCFARAFPPVCSAKESDSNKDGFDSCDEKECGVDLPSGAATVPENVGKNPVNPRVTPGNSEENVA
jgi:hypothetical protein